MPQSAPNTAPSDPGKVRRIAGVASRIFKEIAWALWQACLCVSHAGSSMFSIVRERRLNAKRHAILLQVGTDIQAGVVPDHLRALKDECDRLDREVRQHRDAAATSANWWARGRSKISLLIANSAREKALRKLGESGIEKASPERRAALAEAEARTAREKARRAQLWQPWRALSIGRQAEIIAALTMFLIAAAIFFHHRSTTTPQQILDANVRNEFEPAPQDPASRLKKEHELAAAFAREVKAAPAGDWLVYAGNPVLERGELNEWDDFKIGNEVVMADGSRFQMWYRACHFVMRQYTCGVGLATSTDGVLWQKSEGPVFVPSDNHERERLDSLAIVRAADQYWMWYSVRPDRFRGFAYPTIHLATSKDGRTWVPAGAVLRAMSQYTGNLEPAAYWDGKLFHMWYTDHPTDENPAILHLTSSDGKQWQTAGSTPLSTLKMDPGRLSVMSDGRGGYRAYFASTGQERSAGVFGVLLSSDGNAWQRADSEPKLSFQDVGSARGLAVAPSVFAAANGMWVWYTFRPHDGAEEISLAFLKEKSS